MNVEADASYLLLAVIEMSYATEIIDWSLSDGLVDRFVMLAGEDALGEAMEVVTTIGDSELSRLMLPEEKSDVIALRPDFVRMGADMTPTAGAVEGRLVVVTQPTVVFMGLLEESVERLIRPAVLEWESE